MVVIKPSRVLPLLAPVVGLGFLVGCSSDQPSPPAPAESSTLPNNPAPAAAGKAPAAAGKFKSVGNKANPD